MCVLSLPDADVAEVTALVIAAGFVISVIASCGTDLLCRLGLLKYDWEAIILPNEGNIPTHLKAIFRQGVPSKPTQSDGEFYPFLVYHHVHIRKKYPEIFAWSLRHFNWSVVAVNSVVGLWFATVVVTILAILNRDDFVKLADWRIVLWVGGNVVFMMLLTYHAYFTRRRRRRLFQYLAGQVVT